MKYEACANLQITDNVIVVRVWYLLPFSQFYNNTTSNKCLFILSITVIFQKDWVCGGEGGGVDQPPDLICILEPSHCRAFHERFHALYAVKGFESLL